MGICVSKALAKGDLPTTDPIATKHVAVKQRELSIDDSSEHKDTYGVVQVRPHAGEPANSQPNDKQKVGCCFKLWHSQRPGCPKQAPSDDSPITDGTDEHLEGDDGTYHVLDTAQLEFLEHLGVPHMQELVCRTLWVGLREDKRDTCKYWEGQVYRVKGSTVRMFFDNEEPQEFSVGALQRLWSEQLLFSSEEELRRARPGAAVRRLRKSLKGKVPVRQTVIAESSSRVDDQGSGLRTSETFYLKSSVSQHMRTSDTAIGHWKP